MTPNDVIRCDRKYAEARIMLLRMLRDPDVVRQIAAALAEDHSRECVEQQGRTE